MSSEETEIVNATIVNQSAGFDREIFLCCHLTFDYGNGTHQGFGGHVLGGEPGSKAGEHGANPNWCAEYLVGVLRAAGVESMTQLPGKNVRVKREVGWGGKVIAIGHITKDDLWFDPETAFKKLRDEHHERWSTQS